MRTIMTLVSVAALALAAPALADRGGKGGGEHGGKAAKAERGGKGAQKAARAERRGGGQVRKAEKDGGKPVKASRAAREWKAERGRGNFEQDGRKVRVAREDRRPAKAERDGKRVHRDRIERDQDERIRVVRDARSGPQLRSVAADRYVTDRCPPGLAAKSNGCLPPGQAKKLVGARLPDRYWDERPPAYYRTWYPDTDRYLYRAGSGYLYRVNRDTRLVSGFMPLYDWDDHDVDYYSVGERYPIDTYSYYNVPAAYQPYYADSDDHYYRYGDGAIYQVSRGNGIVEAIVALLAGDLAVGSPLPAGYDAYNVPLDYRDRYYDTPDAWYRYNDGYIYQVDPQTRLIQAVIEALV